MALHEATNTVANDQTIRAVCTANGGTFQFTDWDRQQARNPPGCVDTAIGATDVDGDSCGAYGGTSGICGYYDDGDFDSMAMCCACGGGSIPGNYEAMLEIAPLRTGVALVADEQRCTIAGDSTFRLLWLHRASELTLENLVFMRGYASGVRV